MPRHARFLLPGVPTHVVQRGNNRGICFRSDADRTLYLALVRDWAPRHGCQVHAYVLMDNHVHILVTPDRPDGLSNMFKQVGQRFTQYVNRHYHRSGSLWEGRFKSSLVDSDPYLMRCYRYIELNPVRAGMVGDPGHHPWSSYRTNAWGEPSPIVSPHGNYLSLGNDDPARRTAYRDLVAMGLSEHELMEIRAAVTGGFALGSAEFISRVGAQLHARPIAARPGRPVSRWDAGPSLFGE